MTTSGTYAFNPNLGSLTQQAFRRCGVPRSGLTAEHMLDATNEANLLLVEWANKGVNLWKVDLLTWSLVAGTATYTVDPTTVDLLDVYLSTLQGDGTYVDRQMVSVSRSEYAAYPMKTTQAPPSVYWFNRVVAPTITLYPVPDDASTYVLKAYRMVRMQDAAPGNALTVDLQYLWLEAFVSGLSGRLAVIYAPDRAIPLAALAGQQWQTAADANVEDAAFYVAPGLGSYYR